MKISEVISKLEKLQNELGDVPVVIFSEEGEYDVDVRIREVDSIERINIGKSDRPKMAVAIDC